ncbi:hypothetical protein K523DRAFT_93576 [Schizophyllum commune Tattone D]|nr:hypothetical protein K523DRAFT_93576 [Schizophyllum commune Tattone D]
MCCDWTLGVEIWEGGDCGCRLVGSAVCESQSRRVITRSSPSIAGSSALALIVVLGVPPRIRVSQVDRICILSCRQQCNNTFNFAPPPLPQPFYTPRPPRPAFTPSYPRRQQMSLALPKNSAYS